MQLVGLGYRKRCGKDSVADVLAGYGWRRMAFADTLKAAAAEIFGFTREQLHGDLKDVVDQFWGFTPGWALQKLGTEGVRAVIGQDTWVRAMERRLRKIPEFIPGVAITDVRFPNEAEMILARGGRVVRVDRPSLDAAVPDGSVAGARSAAHPSETSLVGWDGWSDVILNDGKLEDLRAKVVRLFIRI